MKSLQCLFVLAVAVFASACTSVSTFKVDAISAPQQIVGRSYRLIPANPETSPKDLRFMEAERYVRTALAAQGYTPVQGEQGADMVITLDVAIGEPENVTRTRPTPIYAEEGGYYRVARVRVTDRDGNASYVRTTVWSPPYMRVIGSVDSAYTETLYEKRMALTAFAGSSTDGEDLPQLWSVVVLARDTNGDLRSILPQMALAAATYAGKDTSGQVEYSVKADAPELLYVRGETTSAQ
ncbi:MAG: hypothetical protein JW942_07900 [Opitutales bacterium]|nr:hypothetical protein [Opitutales bacterium]